MAYFVYIIQSELDNSYYKGFTEEPLQRLRAHNSGESNYTSTKMPWKFVYLEKLATKREALIRERALKKYSHSQIEKILILEKNSLQTFLIENAGLSSPTC